MHFVFHLEHLSVWVVSLLLLNSNLGFGAIVWVRARQVQPTACKRAIWGQRRLGAGCAGDLERRERATAHDSELLVGQCVLETLNPAWTGPHYYFISPGLDIRVPTLHTSLSFLALKWNSQRLTLPGRYQECDVQVTLWSLVTGS